MSKLIIISITIFIFFFTSFMLILAPLKGVMFAIGCSMDFAGLITAIGASVSWSIIQSNKEK